MNVKSSERVVIVYNSKSSHAAKVQSNVFDRLQASGVDYAMFITPSPRPEDNSDAVADFVQAGDTWLSAAGDGTANAVGNGLLIANEDAVRLGFLGYGNFNDTAVAFNHRAARRNPLLQLNPTVRTIELRPLEIVKNDEHWRYALLYATLGWTALAAHEFDDPKTRESLQQGGANIVSSLARLGLFYFKTRRSSNLSPFEREDGSRHDNLTDVLAVNGPIMAKIIRSHQAKYADSDFLSRDLNITKFIRNSLFLVSSGLGYMPGKLVTTDTLQFSDLASVPIQLDGEFVQLDKVAKLQIRKSVDAPTLQVITTR